MLSENSLLFLQQSLPSLQKAKFFRNDLESPGENFGWEKGKVFFFSPFEAVKNFFSGISCRNSFSALVIKLFSLAYFFVMVYVNVF